MVKKEIMKKIIVSRRSVDQMLMNLCIVMIFRNMDLLTSKLLLKSILDLGKCSHWKCANTYLHVISVWPLPDVQNWLQKHFWNEKLHISIVKKKGAFWPILLALRTLGASRLYWILFVQHKHCTSTAQPHPQYSIRLALRTLGKSRNSTVAEIAAHRPSHNMTSFSAGLDTSNVKQLFLR